MPAEATLVSSVDEAPFQVWEIQPAPDTPDFLDFKIGGAACLTAREPRQPLANDCSAAASTCTTRAPKWTSQG